MLKYDHQLTEVKTRLLSANRILVILPQDLNIDNLSAGLSIYLSFKTAGKKVDIVSSSTPEVSQSNLFGIGDIKNDIPKSGGGNFIISLDGVVDTTGTMQQVPALEKLDWYPEGSKLNLVFHVIPGQRFEPTNITSRHEQTGYDLTWVIGCQSLNELGNLFISNSQYFAQSQVINIDTNPLNAYFGFANVVDPQASSLSEIVAHILPSLTLSMDLDMASNIIAGIYSATNNLTTKVNPDTFMAVSQAVQAGGILPFLQDQTPKPQPEVKIDYEPQFQMQAQIPAQPEPQSQFQTQPSPKPQEMPVPNLQSSPFIVPPQDIYIPTTPQTQPQAQTQVQPEPQPQVQTQQQPQPQFQFQFNQPFDSAQGKPLVQSDSQAQPASQRGEPVTAIPQANNQGFDLRQIFQIPQMPSAATPANPAPDGTGRIPQPAKPQQPPQAQVSQEERPMGEFATTPSPEIESTPTPDWLVPKIFKGGNLG